MTTSSEFSLSSFVKAKLLRTPIYREDAELWEPLRAHQDEIRHYFRQIGQELVMDESEGFAFIRQMEIEGEERIPRLVQRRSLSYYATLLLVCLREEFIRFDSSTPESGRLVKTRSELYALVSSFLPETNNQVRDVAKLDAGIERLIDLGFLRYLGPSDRDTFEIMRIVKARITPIELEAVRERLIGHANS